MANLIINNVGPVKEAAFDLNKVNVIMGPQSSGKSTIAKIISYCTWVEKDVATSQSLKTYQDNKSLFKEHIENFHKIKGYFRADSYISFKSDVVDILWENQECEIKWVDQYAYKRSKISYIPSERNMVILPDVKKVEFGNTNVRSFLFDWFDARKNYPKENKLSILKLEVDYYFMESGMNEEDHIRGIENNREYDILLSNASSGLQSITPLLGMIDYLTNWIYKEDNTSFLQEDKQRKVSNLIIDEKILKPFFKVEVISKDERKDKIQEINDKIRDNDPIVRKLFLDYKKQITNLFSTHNTQFIIEEPEQNLFPETQRDLIYHLLEKCLNREGNRLTITTHSPYVLYALNNCMMGGLVYDNMKEQDKDSLKCKQSLIKPNQVSAYEIHKGVLTPIQQDDKLIGANFFDKNMKELMNDFYVLLNYYGK